MPSPPAHAQIPPILPQNACRIVSITLIQPPRAALLLQDLDFDRTLPPNDAQMHRSPPMFTPGAIGADVTDWTPPPPPPRVTLTGQYVELTPLSPEHGPAIYRAIDGDPDLWLYMGAGPFATEAEFQSFVQDRAASQDPQFYAIRKTGGEWCGMASFMRITPADGVIEVGNILFSPALQGSPAATEAMMLMADHAFSLGYRRYEWKCNAFNASSRRAAQRLGFSYEGTFRQHMIIKGKNRDTAWFSILDSEWPALRTVYETWLSPSNFDREGQQRLSLSTLTRPLLKATDPGLR